VLFIEFKAPGKQPTALQLKWLLDLHLHGAHVAWCDDVGKGKEMIQTILLK